MTRSKIEDFAVIYWRTTT